MRVMVLVKASAESEAGEMPGEEPLSQMLAYNEELVDAGVMKEGNGLHPSSEGARVGFSGDEREVTRGPFAQPEELVAGYWLWEVASLEEAIDWVKRAPNPGPGRSVIEIRPIFETDDFGDELTPELRDKEAELRRRTEADQ